MGDEISAAEALASADNVFRLGERALYKNLFDDKRVGRSFVAESGSYFDRIVGYAREALRSDELSYREEGDHFYITYKGREVAVPLKDDPGDSMAVIRALADALAPDLDLRFYYLSYDWGGSYSFIALEPEVWQTLQDRYPELVEQFVDPRIISNIATELRLIDFPPQVEAALERMWDLDELEEEE